VLTIVHGSDIHLGKPFRPEVAESFVAAAHAAEPDLVVISGDLTQRAKVREFEAARDFLDRLPRVPCVVTPGNHDVPLYRVVERILTPHRNYRAHIEEDLNTVTRVPGATVVALDSSAPRTAIVNGRIRGWQVEFARRAFDDAPVDDIRIVVAHHHFAPAPDYEGDRSMPRAKAVLEAFTAMGVEMILGGHLHRAYIGNSLDVFAGSEGSKGVVIVQSGTTTSARGRARERAKNSFNVIRVGREALEVTHHMYFEEVGTFEPFSVHAFPRQAHRWFPEGSVAAPLDGVGGEAGPHPVDEVGRAG
jgi:3',5'-cyclic AMP phosphodiesterase CpdA